MLFRDLCRYRNHTSMVAVGNAPQPVATLHRDSPRLLSQGAGFSDLIFQLGCLALLGFALLTFAIVRFNKNRQIASHIPERYKREYYLAVNRLSPSDRTTRVRVSFDRRVIALASAEFPQFAPSEV